MFTNPVIEAIYAAFKLEIANQITFDNYALTIKLPDESRLVITAYPVNSKPVAHTVPPQSTSLCAAHTFHYIHQHDFTANENHVLERLMLHNVEECRTYLDDVCITFLNATLRDGEVTFSNGTTYLITITPA